MYGGGLVSLYYLLPNFLLPVFHHQKGGVCEYKITLTKMFLIHGKLHKHTSNKAQAEELKEKQALVTHDRAGRPTMNIGRLNTSKTRGTQKNSNHVGLLPTQVDL